MSVRIYQLARQLNLENKEVIRLLQERGLEVKGPSSTIPNIYAEDFIKDFQSKSEVAVKEEVSEEPAAKQEVAPIVVEPEPKEEVAQEQEVTVAIEKPKEAKKGVKLPKPAPKIFVKSAEDVAAEKQKVLDQKKAIVILPETQIEQYKQQPIQVVDSDFAKKPVTAPKIQLPTKTPVVFKKQEIKKPVEEQKQEKSSSDPKQISIKPPIVVREFASLLDIKPFRLISELMEIGIFASMNQSIDEEVAQKIATKYGINIVFKHRTQQQPAKAQVKEKEVVDESKFLKPRPPIVCVLGHVDHGKTTLIDYIRKTNVVAKEAGGITQHVGAYQITHNSKKITFLDTPGHAAFSKIRQRGATVTDIAILVVAADDGFMPQTDEALKFAQKENVPVVVAINKIDSKGANIDRVKQQMQKRGITSEDWGGETLCVPISGLKGTNIDELLEAVLLQAEMLELKANPSCAAEGVVIESKIEPGKGATATVIIDKGTLKKGDALLCGACYCKARALLNEHGENLTEAGPSTPVQILGWSDAPDAGASFKSSKNEKEAKKDAEDAARKLKLEQGAKDSEGKIKSINELLAAIESNKQRMLKIIIRADVNGSAEALVDCINDIKSQKVSTEIISSEIGQVSKNDINLANASGAVIVAFNTKLENGVLSDAKHYSVRIIQHNIIYEIIEQVKEAMSELLDPELVENKLGSAEIRQLFPLAKAFVAGCMVIAGKITRDSSARLLRKNEIVYTGKIQMLKRFKDDATEVKSGYECGIQMNGNPDYQIGDVIECFEIISKRPAL